VGVADYFKAPYYIFKHETNRQCTKNLHITSTHFNDPDALNMLKYMGIAVAFHGHANNGNVVCLGGNMANGLTGLKDDFIEHFKMYISPLMPEAVIVDAANPAPAYSFCKKIDGSERSNIVNRSRTGIGGPIGDGRRFQKKTDRRKKGKWRALEEVFVVHRLGE
jgi:phage replication-related protein YjqB (UPF0714/DUF867 family)